jgi:hypothetical protein
MTGVKSYLACGGKAELGQAFLAICKSVTDGDSAVAATGNEGLPALPNERNIQARVLERR